MQEYILRQITDSYQRTVESMIKHEISKENITRNIDQDPVKFACSIDVQNQSHNLSSMAVTVQNFSSQPTKLQTTRLLSPITVLTVE